MSVNTCRPEFNQIEIGPVESPSGDVYKYKACGFLSTHSYANPASALYAARRPQRFTSGQTLSRDARPTVEPVPGL